MSFRCIQRFSSGSFSPIFINQIVKDKDTGSFVSSPICSSDSKLPDSQLFELDNLLEAKIPLQQVNSRLVGGASVDLDALAKAKTPKTPKSIKTEEISTTTTTKNGVENE